MKAYGQVNGETRTPNATPPKVETPEVTKPLVNPSRADGNRKIRKTYVLSITLDREVTEEVLEGAVDQAARGFGVKQVTGRYTNTGTMFSARREGRKIEVTDLRPPPQT